MKKTIFILVIFLQNTCLLGQVDTIYGPIKSVREYVEYYKPQSNSTNSSYRNAYGEFGIISPERTTKRFKYVWYNTSNSLYINYYKLFLKNRKPKKEIWFGKSNDTLRKYIYSYDKNDNLIQNKLIYDDGSILYINNKYKGKRILTSHSFETDFPSDYQLKVYKTDYNGNILECKSIDETGNSSLQKFTYDSLLRNVAIFTNPYHSVLDSALSPSNKYDYDYLTKEYKYDQRDNVIEEKLYNPKLHYKISEYQGKLVYTYDNEGRIISNSKYSKINELLDTKTTSFNGKMKMVKRTSQITPNFDWSKEYFYDKNKNLRKLIYKSALEEYTVDFKQKIDKYGNWTQQIKSVNGEKIYKWVRKLEYYSNH